MTKSNYYVSSSSDSDTDNSDSSSPAESEDETCIALCFLKLAIIRKRYIFRQPTIPKSDDFYSNVLFRLDEDRFRQEMRMTTLSFCKVLKLVADHLVFKDKGLGKKQQTCVQKQVSVALYMFGMYGNAASRGQTARHFGIAEGSVDMFVRRVIVALISHESEKVNWPDSTERKQIKERIF